MTVSPTVVCQRKQKLTLLIKFLYWIYWITSNLLIWKTLFRTCSCKHVMLALYGHQLYILSHYDNERRPNLHPCLEDRFGSTLVPNKKLYLISIVFKNLLIWGYRISENSFRPWIVSTLLCTDLYDKSGNFIFLWIMVLNGATFNTEVVVGLVSLLLFRLSMAMLW